MTNYLERMDEDAQAIRDRYKAEGAMRARAFDPRRSQLLGMFDMMDTETKDRAIRLIGRLAAKAKQGA
jgi:hypothetical protein